MEHDTLCGSWKNWYGTLSHCREVYLTGNTLTLTRSDGAASFRASLHPPNVRKVRARAAQ